MVQSPVKSAATLHSTNGPKHLCDVGLFFLGLIGCGLLATWSGKDLNWDLFNYHFYNGWAAWTSHTWTNIAPAQLQSFLNPAMDVLQYLAIAHLPPWWTTFGIGAFQGINFYLVFKIVESVIRPRSGWPPRIVAIAAGAAALAGPATISEFGSTMGDLTLAVPVLLAVLLIIQSFDAETGQRAGWKVLGAGVCLGASVGIKYTIGPYAVAAAGTLLLWSPPSLSRIGALFRLCSAGLLGFAVAAVPWMVALSAHYKNPMFPFFNGWFRSPFALPINWVDDTFAFRSWLDLLGFPFSLVRQGMHHLQIMFRSLTLPFAYGCLLVSIFLGVRSYLRSHIIVRPALTPSLGQFPPAQLWLLGYFAFSYLIWAKMFGDYRYFTSSEVLAPAIIVVAICQLTPNQTVRILAAISCALAIIAYVSTGSWGRGNWEARSYFDVGLPSARSGGNDTLVVMTGLPGLAFVIPFFPSGTRFVRAQSNFNGLQTPAYASLVSRAIAAHHGPFALLEIAPDLAESAAFLRQYALTIVDQSCKPIRSLYSSPIVFCALVRSPTHPANARAK